MAIVAIIPARGGSRGLPGKHLRLLAGEPLIAHTVRAALAARRIDRVLVSTDDPAVARAARRAGAEVPFLRPAELAAADTPTLPVIRHAVEWLEAGGERVDVAVTLQPTSPLRDAAQIDTVLALLDRSGADSAVSVTSLGLPISVVGHVAGGRFVPAVSPGGDVRRQAAPAAVRVTGGVYATRRALLDAGRLLGERPAAYLVDGPSAIDVDSADDLRAARRALRSLAGGASR
jgi:CMP-N-acetylneuraminic acid synthetase